MLEARGNRLFMNEGDYGVILPVQLSGGELETGDVIRFSVDTVLYKDFPVEEMADRAFLLCLTEEESALLPAGSYLWKLTLLRDGVERNTVKGPCLLTVLEG